MLKVLIIFIAFAFGLLAFATFQTKDLPNELEFLLHNPAHGVLAPEEGEFTERRLEDGWIYRAQGKSIELFKRFSGEISSNGERYDVPSIGIICQAPNLDARIDTRMATNGADSTTVLINGKPTTWVRGSGNNIFPENPKALILALAGITGVTNAQFTFDFESIGKRTVSLEVASLKTNLGYFPQSCLTTEPI